MMMDRHGAGCAVCQCVDSLRRRTRAMTTRIALIRLHIRKPGRGRAGCICHVRVIYIIMQFCDIHIEKQDRFQWLHDRRDDQPQ